MVGRDSFSPLAPALGSTRTSTKNTGYVTLFRRSLVVSMMPNTRYITFEQILQAAFVTDTIWGVQLKPARSDQDLCLYCVFFVLKI